MFLRLGLCVNERDVFAYDWVCMSNIVCLHESIDVSLLGRVAKCES